MIRFGRGLADDDIKGLVQTLRDLAYEKPVRRMRIEAFSERPNELRAVAAACQEAGFQRAAEYRSYARTAWLDLRPSEDELLAGFHKSARSSIRAPGKKGLEVRRIVDPSAARPVRELLAAAFRRTGSEAPMVDWEVVIEAVAAPASRICMAGLFRKEDPRTSEPLSFAVAYLHGDVAEYAHAGSLRDPTIRVPLLYDVSWYLMLWAKAHGATEWDFGGVTEGSAGTEGDPRGGISDFKRLFTRHIVEVGEEWVLEPRGWAGIVRR